jgi:hypothetical protein
VKLALDRGRAEYERCEHCQTDVLRVYDAVRHFDRYYPDFEAWFWQKVVPGLHDGTRRLETVVRDGELAGLTILKDADERKVCTLWVADRFVGTGMGIRLLRDSARSLGGKPLATVPEERIATLGPALIGLGFELTDTVESAYRPGRCEFVFNGYLRHAVS